MAIFSELLVKLIPLYFIIALGFIAGRYLKVEKESIAPLLIYIVSPFIVFDGVVRSDLSIEQLSLPFVTFTLCTLVALIAYFLAAIYWKDSKKNILAYASATGNTGYFGLPVAMAFWGHEVFSTTVLLLFGFTLFESTIGYFIVARGRHTVKESVIKVLKLPSMYAFCLGLILASTQSGLFSDVYHMTASHFRGAYTLLGMMIIGLGLCGIINLKMDYAFTLFTFFMKFLIWPFIIVVLILIDHFYFHWMGQKVYDVLFLMSIVPLAANTIVYAVMLNTHPQESAIAVLLSTLFAIVYIPLMLWVFEHTLSPLFS